LPFVYPPRGAFGEVRITASTPHYPGSKIYFKLIRREREYSALNSMRISSLLILWEDAGSFLFLIVLNTARDVKS